MIAVTDNCIATKNTCWYPIFATQRVALHSKKLLVQGNNCFVKDKIDTLFASKITRNFGPFHLQNAYLIPQYEKYVSSTYNFCYYFTELSTLLRERRYCEIPPCEEISSNRRDQKQT